MAAMTTRRALLLCAGMLTIALPNPTAAICAGDCRLETCVPVKYRVHEAQLCECRVRVTSTCGGTNQGLSCGCFGVSSCQPRTGASYTATVPVHYKRNRVTGVVSELEQMPKIRNVGFDYVSTTIDRVVRNCDCSGQANVACASQFVNFSLAATPQTQPVVPHTSEPVVYVGRLLVRLARRWGAAWRGGTGDTPVAKDIVEKSDNAHEQKVVVDASHVLDRAVKVCEGRVFDDGTEEFTCE